MSKKPTVLMILDGYGLNETAEANAVAKAATPVMDKLMAEYPFVKGNASGMAVGLPEGQMGNSEVGHLNMGAGRIVYQELTRITKTVEEGGLSAMPELQKAVSNCKEHGSALHLMGLLSDGGVHSHIQHLFGLLAMAKEQGLEKVYVHCFMDGRDVPPSSGKDYVEQLQAELNRLGVGKIATICGRYYAMDRDNRWERVSKAYDAMVNGIGVEECNPVKAMEDSYANGVTDEFVVPVVVDKNGMISENDSVIFFNFRPDRAREITRTLVDEAFTGFERAKGFFPLCYTCMTQYDATMPNVQVAFHPQSLEDTFGEMRNVQPRSVSSMKPSPYTTSVSSPRITFVFAGL